MIDSGTGLTILGSAIGGAKVVEKILGPTSEFVGEQIKEWAVKKITNTANVFKNAEKKLGDKINQPGSGRSSNSTSAQSRCPLCVTL